MSDASTRENMIEWLRGVLDDAFGDDSVEGAEAFLRKLNLVYIDPALVAETKETIASGAYDNLGDFVEIAEAVAGVERTPPAPPPKRCCYCSGAGCYYCRGPVKP
jgi:hypothetical protein